MSRRICVDTHALIWGIQKDSRPEQAGMIPLAVGFFEKCKIDGAIVVIPAVAIAEMLAKIPPEERTRFQESISREFIVAPFDMAAAAHYADIQYSIIKKKAEAKTNAKTSDNNVNANHPHTRSCIKADSMIVASALTSQCDTLCSDDPHMESLTDGRITLTGIMKEQVQAPLLYPDGLGPHVSSDDDA